MKIYKKKHDRFAYRVHFDTPMEVVDYTEQAWRDVRGGGKPTGMNMEYLRGPEAKLACKLVRDGDPEPVEKAKPLLESFAGRLNIQRSGWETSMAGVMPNVPAYVAGAPECMWQRVQVHNESVPVKVFVAIDSPGFVSGKVMGERAVAIIALVLALKMTRPVEFVIYDGSTAYTDTNEEEGIQGVRDGMSDFSRIRETCQGRRKVFESKGIITSVTINANDISELSASLHEGFGRKILYGVSSWHGGTQSIGFHAHSANVEQLRPFLGAAENDIVIGTYWGASASEDANEWRDPVDWVNARLAEQGMLEV